MGTVGNRSIVCISNLDMNHDLTQNLASEQYILGTRSQINQPRVGLVPTTPPNHGKDGASAMMGDDITDAPSDII